MFRSFCLTIRPRDGIKDNLVQKITQWLAKQQYAVGVLEMENEARHLHAQIWSDTERHKNDILKQMKRFCESLIEDWDAAQTKVLRGGVKIAYSDWYLEYLLDNEQKGTAENVIINNPPDKTERFYPTEEEQEKVKSVANSVDPRFTKLEIDFHEWNEEYNLEVNEVAIAKFLNWSMFDKRTIKVIITPKDRYNLANALLCYITKSSNKYNFIVKTNEEKKMDENMKKVENLCLKINQL